MKETIDQILIDIKEIQEITVIKRKIENIMLILGNMKTTIVDEPEVKSKPQMQSDKYLEITIFNEFMKNYKIQVDNFNIRIDELRRLIDDILLELKKKVSEKDLKNLEGNLILIVDFLLGKFEELRIACNKKFADKNETAKNIKYLDSQVNYT